MSSQTKTALNFATIAARHYKRKWIDAEHLLLGLINTPNCLAAKKLKEAGLKPPLAEELVEKIGNISTNQPRDYPKSRLSEDIFRLLTISKSEAVKRNHTQIDNAHLLLAMLQLKEGIAFKIVKSAGADISSLNRDLIQMLNAQQGEFVVELDVDEVFIDTHNMNSQDSKNSLNSVISQFRLKLKNRKR